MNKSFHRLGNFAATLMVFLTVSLFCTFHASAKDFVVVIDAGHGGKDGGAPGSYSNEKDINLAVAKRLGEEIKSRYKDVKVVFTRSTDVFVTIKGRMDKAKAVNADLFISLHCNSAANSNPQRKSLSGTSVYVLGTHNADDNIDLAMRENSAILLEDDYRTTYAGFDNSPEYYIFTEINQTKMMGKSNSVANEIQRELVSHAGLVDKHVNETSRLWLLLHSTMPAILIEMDYICNPAREKFLNSKNGQRKIAEAITNGIDNYRKTLGHKADRKSGSDPDVTSGPDSESASASDSSSASVSNGETVYKIQFLASPRLFKADSPQFKGLSPVSHYKDGKIYKYTYGQFPSQDAAAAQLKTVRKKFPDAFVIKTVDGHRVK